MLPIFDRFTESAKRAMILSQQEAKSFNHNYVGTEHFLLGLMGVKEGLASQVLNGQGITQEEVRQEIIDIVGEGVGGSEIAGYTPRTKRIFELSMVIARKIQHNYVGTEHLLLALLEENEGVAIVVLNRLGINIDDIKREIMNEIAHDFKNEGENLENTETPNLNKYGVDLNEQAEKGKIDPVVGRDKEIDRVIQILSRRTKNNPVLIGEPGVGKTAILEGLAQKIVEGNCPEIIANKRIYSLDIASMIAGAKYRGEFEERLKSVLSELKESPNIVLFIDEIHNIVGAGAAEGVLDASNILKPELARGEIQIVGATTIDEYRKHIEKDSALERRLQTIMVEEPTVEDTITILKGIRDKYEAHHKVGITDEALKGAAELSHRYISDRFLPDKAIDLIDEAASKIRIESYITPVDLKSLEDELEELSQEKEEAINNQNYEKAAKIRDEEKRIREKVDMNRNEWDEEKQQSELLVDYDEIAEIVSDWTGIPITRMTAEETDKLLNLEEKLHEKVVGQEEAVKVVSKAVRRARVGLKDPNKPIGTFMFVGPTGVGKTYLAKSLAEELFGSEDAMIRIDMSEYMEKHSVSKLVGSPPGYVGHDDGGQLTEAVRRKPYSVLLLDEIEKAHVDVFNILLQILDDGRLTDSKGRTVDFKNTVIIMTSNAGATNLKKQNVIGFSSGEELEKEEYERMKEVIKEELKKIFRPEFLNRVDETVVFHSLTQENVREIVDLMILELKDRLENVELSINVSAEARDLLAKKGYDPAFGARPLERTIRDLIEDELAEEILKGTIDKEDMISIDAKDEKLVFNSEKK